MQTPHQLASQEIARLVMCGGIPPDRFSCTQMSSERTVDCRCVQRAEAPWSYCTDDFYCPRCGKAITQLTSDNRHPDPTQGEIWVYPRKVENDEPFAFPLKLQFASSSRQVKERDPNVEFKSCTVDPNGYFDQSIESPGRGKKFLVWLKPNSDRIHESLPDAGIQLRIPRFVGDFGSTSLNLRIGKRPSIDLTLTGKGIEAVVDSEKAANDRALKKRFRVTASGKLDLELAIHALTAPVMVTKPFDAVDWRSIGEIEVVPGSLAFELAHALTPGTEIVPGEPWTTRVTLDTTQFTIPGQKADSNQNLHFLGWPRFRLSLQLDRIEKQGLEFSPNPLTIDEMFLGEIRSNAPHERDINPEDPNARGYQPVIRKFFVKNQSNSTVTLERPIAQTDAPFSWLQVRWADDVDEGSKRPRPDGRLELDANERAEIYLRADFREVTADQLDTIESVNAKIIVRNRSEDETYETKVIVNHVRPRIKARYPLTIDFGNTSSYAAMWNPSSRASTNNQILPMHELRVPERFPTALFFQTATQDPFDSNYSIGRAAILGGEKQSRSGKYGALVTDLKRWLSDENHSKNIIDADENEPVRYSIGDLIVLYLKRIVENAESILRRYTITQISLSHPAKFTLQRRRAFHSIVDHLCEVINRNRSEEFHIERIDEDIDEANAVAVGSVFDEQTEDALFELVTPDRPNFVVASFDLGGGSLDTALIRFQVRDGEIELPEYTTEYLGIGGHSAFGGDNVTLAVMELLKEQIRDAINKTGLSGQQCLQCVPNPTDKDNVDAQRRHNYSVLWEVSEAVKVFQCIHANKPASDEEFSSFAAKVQAQLTHELILDPTAAGTLKKNDDVNAAIKSLVDDRSFLVELSKIYSHEIQHDLVVDSLSENSYTVQERIEDSITELQHFAQSHDAEIDFVVLGGAGSRLPLVGEMIKKHLPNAEKIQDPSRTKFRVAEGLARFLDALNGAHNFARSSDYTISEFGYVQPGRGRFVSIVPNCVPVAIGSAPHEITTRTGKRFDLSRLCDEKSQLWLHRQDQGERRTPHGYFDLGASPDLPGELEPRGFARDELVAATGQVFLNGSEDDMQLEVLVNEKLAGRWLLKLSD